MSIHHVRVEKRKTLSDWLLEMMQHIDATPPLTGLVKKIVWICVELASVRESRAELTGLLFLVCCVFRERRRKRFLFFIFSVSQTRNGRKRYVVIACVVRDTLSPSAFGTD